MPHFLVQYGKKTIPLIYLFTQSVILIVLNITLLINYLHLILSCLAIITYFIVAFSDPGFIIYESSKEPSPKFRSQPVIPTCEVSPRALIDQLVVGELGIQSYIQEEASNRKKDEIIEAQQPFKVLSLVKEDDVKQTIKCQQKVEKEKQPKSYGVFGIAEQLQKAKNEGDQIKQQIIQNKIILEESAGFNICPSKLKSVNRWCKICKNSQELRVRHCQQCKRCISNFDHHCPWINNCIGQKNKLKLIIYILMQDAQLTYLLVHISKSLQANPYKNELLLLWIVALLITIMVSAMLIFHLFLIAKNITTWEHVRWNKIEYLKIFDQKKLISLFDKGFGSNLAIFLKANCSKAKINWMAHISPKAHACLAQIKIDGDLKGSK